MHLCWIKYYVSIIGVNAKKSFQDNKRLHWFVLYESEIMETPGFLAQNHVTYFLNLQLSQEIHLN